MKRENGFHLALCMLTLGITLGYCVTRLLDRMDCHFVSMGHGGNQPKFFRTHCNRPHESGADATEDSNCSEDTNEPEPYTEPLNGSAMDYEEP